MLKHWALAMLLLPIQTSANSPVFDWDDTPIQKPETPVTPNQPGLPPALNAPLTLPDPFKHLDSMMKRFFDPGFMNLPSLPQIPASSRAKMQVREAKNFIIVEVPLEEGSDPAALSFSLQGQMLTMTIKQEQQVEENSNGRRSFKSSVTQSSSTTMLPAPVQANFTRQVHKDKILLTFEKL